MTTTKTAAKEVTRARARLAGQSLRGIPGEVAIEKTRADLVKAQGTAGALAELDAVELRNSGASPEEWIGALKITGVPLGVVLLEATELLAYLVRSADRPDELLAALRERVNAAGTTT